MLDLATAIEASRDIDVAMLLSDAVELRARLERVRLQMHFLPMFAQSAGAVTELWRVPRLRRAVAHVLREGHFDAVVEMMTHLWSPFLEEVIRDEGVTRAAIVHDVDSHPGDLTAVANGWRLASALRADRVLALSRYVASRIERRGSQARVATLFHPDFAYAPPAPPRGDGPLRIMTFGRLYPYKGLDRLTAAVARVRASGASVQLGVFGAGNIAPLRAELEAMGAEIVNRWLDDIEIGAALTRYDVVAATHREASQSGIVAAAFGAGRPVLATPVGALPEQVRHGETGLVAARADTTAIADALQTLAGDRALVVRMAQTVPREAPEERQSGNGLRCSLRASCPTLGARGRRGWLLAGLSNHLHGFDLYYRRAYHVRFACSSIFRWRRTWLLHRSRHFHLLVDVSRPFGLR